MSTRVDLTKPPEIEYEEDDDVLNLHWFSDGKNSMFSLIIRDGVLIGCNVSAFGGRLPWKVDIPKGLIRIDRAAMAERQG